jgi:hypothetical protein
MKSRKTRLRLQPDESNGIRMRSDMGKHSCKGSDVHTWLEHDLKDHSARARKMVDLAAS